MFVIKEIFSTLQGEGANAGRAAVFVRFAGCNLWSGREEDRQTGAGTCSRWCDTDFVGGTRYDGVGAVLAAIEKVAPANRLVVFTGGEPSLQLTRELLLAVEAVGYSVAIETNGTRQLPDSDAWVTVSPKAGTRLVVTRADEIKVVYPQPGLDPCSFDGMDFGHKFIQPMDGPERDANLRAAIAFCQEHPSWHLSLQTHKILGLP